MNKKIKLIICGIVAASIIGISAYSINASKNNTKNIVDTSTIIAENIDDNWDEDFSKVNNEASITLNGDSIGLDGSGATVDGSKITITSAGIYTLTGNLNDGQIIVDAGDNDKVKLILNGVDINCSNSAPIYVVNADKTVIDLKDGSNNTITDGENYVFEDTSSEEPNSAIYSKDDLIISGNGTLTVNGNYNNGIVSKDDLKITGGNVTVTAVKYGIKGKDSVRIKDGNIKVIAGGDGIKTDNSKETEKGYIYIAGGTIDITSEQDGIQADTTVLIKDGDIKITSGGGSEKAVSKNNNKDFGGKGFMMKPDGEGMTPPDMDENSQNRGEPPTKPDGDASEMQNMGEPPTKPDMNENSQNGGTNPQGEAPTDMPNNQNTSTSEEDVSTDTEETASTKGIKAGTNITIENGTITINDGEIHIVSSDDGLNAAEKNSSVSTKTPGKNDFNSSSNAILNINGGYVYVDASGDGVDSNGSIKMTGGTVIVNGPTDSGNGALDYDGEFNMTGGLLVVAGSIGMAQAPSTSSTQYSMNIGLSSVQEAKTLINISDKDGNSILTFAPSKQYQSVVVCSPDLKKGTTYTVSTGGTSTGEEKDGLYSNGTYSGGTEYESAEISSLVTSVGKQGGMNNGENMKNGGGRRNMEGAERPQDKQNNSQSEGNI